MGHAVDNSLHRRSPRLNRLRFGVVAGLVFGLLDILPMLAMELANKSAAVAGAFVNRFAIGLLIPLVVLPGPGWVRGLVIGVLLSVPDAIITGAWAPILGIGAVGGTIIGTIVGRGERRSERLARIMQSITGKPDAGDGK